MSEACAKSQADPETSSHLSLIGQGLLSWLLKGDLDRAPIKGT